MIFLYDPPVRCAARLHPPPGAPSPCQKRLRAKSGPVAAAEHPEARYRLCRLLLAATGRSPLFTNWLADHPEVDVSTLEGIRDFEYDMHVLMRGDPALFCRNFFGDWKTMETKLPPNAYGLSRLLESLKCLVVDPRAMSDLLSCNTVEAAVHLLITDSRLPGFGEFVATHVILWAAGTDNPSLFASEAHLGHLGLQPRQSIFPFSKATGDLSAVLGRNPRKFLQALDAHLSGRSQHRTCQLAVLATALLAEVQALVPARFRDLVHLSSLLFSLCKIQQLVGFLFDGSAPSSGPYVPGAGMEDAAN